MVEWSYIHPRKSTYQFQQGSAVENVSIWSLNLPSSRKLIVRFSAIFPALWPLTWHENCAKWGSSCYFIQLSAIYFKWWRKVIFVEKNTRSFRQDDQVTRHRQFREWRKTGVVPTGHTAMAGKLGTFEDLWHITGCYHVSAADHVTFDVKDWWPHLLLVLNSSDTWHTQYS